MPKLKKQFEDFNNEIKIKGEANQLREKRTTLEEDLKDKFPNICKDNEIEINKSEIKCILQGSYKLGTTIRNFDGSVDSDIAVIFPLDINEHSDPRKIKKYARDSIKIENRRIPDIKEPCITVGYHKAGEEYIHIDFALYAEENGITYLARGKEFSDNYSWEKSDPEGLIEYLGDKLNGKDQLRRIIRFLKKWKQEQYKKSQNKNEVPPSIGLTLLACEHYEEKKVNGKHDDLEALQHLFSKIEKGFILQYNSDSEISKAEITCNLPKEPFSDVFYKIKNSDSYGVKFYNKVINANQNLKDAINSNDDHKAGIFVQKVLGDEFEIPAKEAKEAAPYVDKEKSFG